METYMLPVRYEHLLQIKRSKAIPVIVGGGLSGCEMLRIPHCLNNRLTDGGEVVSFTGRPRFTPQIHYFLLLIHIPVRG
jgi:hypothetical protein